MKGRLDLIASDQGLINVDLDLATELGGASQVKITKKPPPCPSPLKRKCNALMGRSMVDKALWEGI